MPPAVPAAAHAAPTATIVQPAVPTDAVIVPPAAAADKSSTTWRRGRTLFKRPAAAAQPHDAATRGSTCDPSEQRSAKHHKPESSAASASPSSSCASTNKPVPNLHQSLAELCSASFCDACPMLMGMDLDSRECSSTNQRQLLRPLHLVNWKIVVEPGDPATTCTQHVTKSC